MADFWNLTSTISLTLSILFLFGYNYEDVSAVPTTNLCLPEQRDALLQFKNEFEVLNSSFPDDYCINGIKPHRKTKSWMNNSDCCTWDGITCNAKTGEVIELDLSCSTLGGRFDSSSSLQNLHSLTTLDLSFNDFSGEIMSSIGNLSHLTSLDLSCNDFSDRFPALIVDLSYLTFLNLSYNYFWGRIPSSIGNLSHLTYLDLSFNRISGQILSSIGNLSHLTFLNLSNNFFSEFIPSSIEDLSCLTFLYLSYNSFSGQIPSSIGNLSHLTHLSLFSNQISGQTPSSIGNLYQLTYLTLSENKIVGEIPSSFGNLNQLTILGLFGNKLNGSLPIALLNLTRLSDLELDLNQFTGTIPPNITSLSKLSFFSASNNAFTGTFSLCNIPSMDTVLLSDNQFNGILELGNISSPPKLRMLSVGGNNLRGPIPATISKFINLVYLDLSHYKTQGPVDFTIFSHLKLLHYLDLSHLNTTTTIDLNDFLSYFKRLSELVLSGNHVSVTNKSPVSNTPLRLMYELYLSGCGITKFPEELVRTKNLKKLDISNNQIKGQVTGWLWTTLPNLYYLDISNNTFTGFENSTKPGLSLTALLASNNNFTGRIPAFICDLRGVKTLDLSNNNFRGLIPPCIGNLKRRLVDLNLRQNRLHGGIPETIFEKLRTLDVGHNQLTGRLPKSLIRFSRLEVLNVESNMINDTIPFWLSSLLMLKILVLRSNAFHGPVHQTSFPKLQIIDISHNQFNGALPSDYFVKWSAMSSLADFKSSRNDYQPDEMYMGDSYYHDSLVLMNKGLQMELVRVLKIYTALDFSGNKFEGEIPSSIGLLKELHVLNLSNNAFTGHIPPSMGNLTALESLDVSQNQLSGEIPQELGSLSFLSYMNFSHNQLSGLVPGGTQFRRLNCTSFGDNPGLFGPSLDEICRDIHAPTTHETPESKEEEEVLSWIAVVIGVVPGIALGWVIGYILFSNRPEWFINPFVRIKRRRSSTTTH